MIFQYIQEDHEPLDDEDDPPVCVFRLIVIPEKRAQLCAKLDAAFGGHHEYVDTPMCVQFKSAERTIIIYLDLPMSEMYEMEQRLGTPSTPKKIKKALMETVLSHITLEAESEVMEALTSA